MAAVRARARERPANVERRHEREAQREGGLQPPEHAPGAGRRHTEPTGPRGEGGEGYDGIGEGAGRIAGGEDVGWSGGGRGRGKEEGGSDR